jgi:hypothetical protein
MMLRTIALPQEGLAALVRCAAAREAAMQAAAAAAAKEAAAAAADFHRLEIRRKDAAAHTRDVQLATLTGASTLGQRMYSDAKVANRDTKVWHFVIENGY